MRHFQAPAALWLIALLGCLIFAFSCSKKEQPASTPAQPTPTQSAAPPTATPPAQSAPASTTAAPPVSTQTSAPAAASPAAIQSQDSNQPNVVADIVQAKRADGVLSVRVRFRNTSTEKTQFEIVRGRNYDKFYVTAANKKYFILKDADGNYLTPNDTGGGYLSIELNSGQAYTWWAKFPAPPEDVKKMTLVTPVTPPFEDVPISD